MLLCLQKLGTDKAKRKLARENAQFWGSVQFFAELTCACERLASLWCSISLCRQQRVSKCHLQIKLFILTRSAVGHAQEEQVETLPELRYRLGYGPLGHRLPTRFEPVFNRLLD